MEGKIINATSKYCDLSPDEWRKGKNKMWRRKLGVMKKSWTSVKQVFVVFYCRLTWPLAVVHSQVENPLSRQTEGEVRGGGGGGHLLVLYACNLTLEVLKPYWYRIPDSSLFYVSLSS